MISTVPLARHRAAYDSSHLQVESFGIDGDTAAAIQQSMKQFHASGERAFRYTLPLSMHGSHRLIGRTHQQRDFGACP